MRRGHQTYSNVGYFLLADVIEKVTGHPFAQDLHRDLLDPNDVNHDRPQRDGFLPNRAVASAALGAGSLVSDAADIARWGYLLYTARVLPTPLTKQMTTPQSSTGTSYGLGTEIYDPNQLGFPDQAVGHHGLIYRLVDNSVQDGYTTILITLPTRHISVAVLTPRTGRDITPIALRLLTLLATADHRSTQIKIIKSAGPRYRGLGGGSRISVVGGR